jgi:hypothetical protein
VVVAATPVLAAPEAPALPAAERIADGAAAAARAAARAERAHARAAAQRATATAAAHIPLAHATRAAAPVAAAACSSWPPAAPSPRIDAACPYTVGTIKAACWAVLEPAGAAGLTSAAIVAAVARARLLAWGAAKTPVNSVVAALSQEGGNFVRVAPCTYALRQLLRVDDGAANAAAAPAPAPAPAAAMAMAPGDVGGGEDAEEDASPRVVGALGALSLKELRDAFAAVVGRKTASKNKQWMRNRLAERGYTGAAAAHGGGAEGQGSAAGAQQQMEHEEEGATATATDDADVAMTAVEEHEHDAAPSQASVQLLPCRGVGIEEEAVADTMSSPARRLRWAAAAEAHVPTEAAPAEQC